MEPATLKVIVIPWFSAKEEPANSCAFQLAPIDQLWALFILVRLSAAITVCLFLWVFFCVYVKHIPIFYTHNWPKFPYTA